MDFDSSSKFIASLARFLQSLCNGYVEFDKGVEVIGHIYLSVDSDTGRKIDYVLNEKVCKNDNSVTFISNSFHAQPAEKPQPAPKKPETDNRSEDSVSLDESGQSVPNSTNVGTIGATREGSGKRPLSPSQRRMGMGRGSGGPASKSSRYQDPSGAPSKSIHTDVSSTNNSLMNSGEDYDSSYQGGEDDSFLSQDYSNSEIDQKPNIEPDISIVKEEYLANQQQSGASYPVNQPTGPGRGRPHMSSQQSSSYPTMHQNSPAYSSSSDYTSSIEPRDPSDDNIWSHSRFQGWDRGQLECLKCHKSFSFPQSLTRHKWKCESSRQIDCVICGCVFHRQDHYKKHLLAKHSTVI